MKRLTKRNSDGTVSQTVKASAESVFYRLAAVEDILGDTYDLDRLRELVQADRDGRCKILPVNIGDTIYYIGGINGKLIYEASVEEIYIGDGTIALGVTRGFTTFTLQESEYFLKKEDAESALKGEQHDKG